MSALTPAEMQFLKGYDKADRLTWAWDGDASYVEHDAMKRGCSSESKCLNGAHRHRPCPIACKIRLPCTGSTAAVWSQNANTSVKRLLV